MHGPDASLGAVDGEPRPARDLLIVGCEVAVTGMHWPLGLGRVKVVIPETTE